MSPFDAYLRSFRAVLGRRVWSHAGVLNKKSIFQAADLSSKHGGTRALLSVPVNWGVGLTAGRL